MNLADYKNIWVFIETECGKPKNVGFELINAAKPLAQEKGCELIAVVIGKDIEGVAKDAICYGADSAIIVDGPEYDGHLVNYDESMRRQAMYKTEEGRATLKLEEGNTHSHGGCGCGGNK